MKQLMVVVCLGWLTACQLTPPATELNTEAATVEPMPEPVPMVEQEPAEVAVLAFSPEAVNLQAWLDYKQQILNDPETEAQRLQQADPQDELIQFQQALVSLHPDAPYISRFRVQSMLLEWLSQLPPPLAAVFSWELSFNQKLLEAESAVSALTRLNAQQQEQLERLQKTNRELQQKIDALTQIEAELNQQPLDETSRGNNG